MAVYSEELAQLMIEATKKKSQRLIAKEAQVSQTTIGNMVMGRIPSRDICTRVAPASDIDIHTMMIACGYEQKLPIDPVERMQVFLKQNFPDLKQEDIDIIEDVIRRREKE